MINYNLSLNAGVPNSNVDRSISRVFLSKTRLILSYNLFTFI